MKSIYLFIFAIFLTFTAVNPGQAIAAGPFTVNNIQVSGQGASAKEAKDNAIAAGQEHAFKQLMSSITTVSEDSWPKLTPEEISDLIQGFDIQKEKVTRKHYEATLNISFNQVLVEKLLKFANISYVLATRSEPVIVLPLYINASGNMLWESQNIWLNAWKKTIDDNGYTQIAIPKGDAKDRDALTPEKLLTKDYPSQAKDKDIVSGIMNKYFSKKLLLAKASKIERDGAIELSVDLTYLLNNEKAENSSFQFKGKPGENVDIVMEKAAREIIEKIGAHWKNPENSSGSDNSKLNVTVAISGMEEWNTLKKRLESYDFIKNIVTKYLTVSYVSLDIIYAGSQYDLLTNLEKRGLYIEQRNNGLYLTETPPANGSSAGWINNISPDPEPDPVPEGWKPNDPEEPKGRKVNDDEL